MAFVEDFTPFIASTEFASSATLNGVTVAGIFDRAYEMAGAGVPGLASSVPTFSLPTANVPSSPVGKSLVIGSTSYTVAEHHPDGTGWSTLLLELA